MLATVHEEYDEDDVDSEWEDFDRLMEEYRLRRRNMPASPLLSSVRHYDHRRAQEQAFYPCPPPQPSELMEDMDYVQTVVSPWESFETVSGVCQDPRRKPCYL
jgi:hypothetical protein